MSQCTIVAEQEIGNLSNRKLLELLRDNTLFQDQLNETIRRVRKELSDRESNMADLTWHAPH